MWFKTAPTLALVCCLGGCSVAPHAPGPLDATLWQDQAFDFAPTLVDGIAPSLFALDEGLLLELRDDPALADRHPARRTARLLTLIFGPDLKAFAYAGGQSTVAAQTWHNRRGDCLSLSILSVALARALGVPAQIQEVQVPVAFDRRNGVDFLNRHVNVLVRNEHEVQALNRRLPALPLVVDFEPQPGSHQRGEPLSDRAVLARFHNNLAAQHLAQDDRRLAYAHFKAAIQAEPAHAAGYANLAQLYLRSGFDQQAEGLLRHALALDERSDLALAALHRLLQSQGRSTEAAVYASRLQARRDQDPYHWLGLGLEHLQQARYGKAVDALERAQSMTSGFEEVHRYLAIAYWRTGQLHRARDQLARLGALTGGEASVAALHAKFNHQPAALAPPH